MVRNKSLKIGVFLFLICFHLYSNAQKIASVQIWNHSIDIEGQQGYEFTQSYIGEPLLNEPFRGINIRYGFLTKGKKRWNSLYRYPTIGIGGQYNEAYQLGEIGSFNTLYGFIEIPFSKPKTYIPLISFDYRISIGLAFNHLSSKSPNKPVIREYAPINIFMGSEVNLFTGFSMEANLRVSQNLRLLIGLDLSHFSNGDVQAPNFGANLIGTHATVRYYLNPIPKKFIEENASIVKSYRYPKTSLYCLVGSGLKESHTDGPFFLKENVQIGLSRRWSEKYQLDLGVDLFYSTRVQGSFTENEPPNDYFYQGVSFTHEAILGRFAFLMGLGIYVHNKFLVHSLIYDRLGIKYYIGNKEHLFAGFNIKAHVQHADNYELNIGTQF
jgi:Lipid A 3-O-deacylase (PagL)